MREVGKYHHLLIIMALLTAKQVLFILLAFISSPTPCSSFTSSSLPSSQALLLSSSSSRRKITENSHYLRKCLTNSQLWRDQQAHSLVPFSLYMNSDSDQDDGDDDDNDINSKRNNNNIDDTTTTTRSSSITSRFTSPILDDPGLPLGDAAVSQIVGPSLQVFWLFLVKAPLPTWLHPIFENALWESRGSLVAPTLIHGAGLSCCWILGALAAGAFERKAFDLNVSSYGTIIWKIIQAGAFATGLLILATQFDLFVEFGGKLVQPGESAETDIRILTAFVEGLNDVVFEAIAILSWRLYRASVTR